MGDADKIEWSMQDDRKFRLWNMFAFIFYCGIRLRSLSHYSCPLQFTSLTFFNRGSTKYGINRIDQKHSSESSVFVRSLWQREKKYDLNWLNFGVLFACCLKIEHEKIVEVLLSRYVTACGWSRISTPRIFVMSASLIAHRPSWFHLKKRIFIISKACQSKDYLLRLFIQ